MFLNKNILSIHYVYLAIYSSPFPYFVPSNVASTTLRSLCLKAVVILFNVLGMGKESDYGYNET